MSIAGAGRWSRGGSGKAVAVETSGEGQADDAVAFNTAAKAVKENQATFFTGTPQEQEQMYRSLTQRHEQLKNQRLRREAQLESLEKELAGIQQQVQKEFGVSTLEEFEVIVQRKLAEETEEWRRFQLALEEEERIQREVEAALNAIR